MPRPKATWRGPWLRVPEACAYISRKKTGWYDLLAQAPTLKAARRPRGSGKKKPEWVYPVEAIDYAMNHESQLVEHNDTAVSA